MSENKQIRVAAAIIKHHGQYLITQRMKQSHLGHLWEFPGGKLEANESAEDCVIRECVEEIGVQVRPLFLLQEVEHQYPEASLKLYFFVCELISGIPSPIECADLKWVNPNELQNFSFPEADLEIIKKLESL